MANPVASFYRLIPRRVKSDRLLVSRRSDYDSLIEGGEHSDARRAAGTTRSWIGSTRHNHCDRTLVVVGVNRIGKECSKSYTNRSSL